MYRNILKIIYFVTILKLSNVYGGTCNGCAELDELLFDKILSKFSTVLVKFDIAYPYGEQHEKYSKFAVETISQNVDFLVAVVGIKDYGQKENSKLAERFRVGAKYPVIKLFRNGNTNEWIDYPKDLNITVKNLRQFVRRHSNVKIILNGCLQQFDDVASSFMNVALRSSLQSKEVKPLLSEADEQMLKLDNEEDKNIAKIYVLYMKRIYEKGLEFISLERKRLQQLLKGKISKSKKTEINQKINILSAFNYDEATSKLHTEL